MGAEVEFPFTLGWLDFGTTSGVNVPVTLEGISLSLEGELVVGESVGGLAVTVVDADLTLSLSGLRESVVLPLLLVGPAELSRLCKF